MVVSNIITLKDVHALIPRNYKYGALHDKGTVQDAKLIHKNLLLFYTLTVRKRSLKEIPFAIASKRIKYLGINLAKDVKDLYIENYKI